MNPTDREVLSKADECNNCTTARQYRNPYRLRYVYHYATVQFTSGQIGSRVPCPYTVHGAQYLHAHGKGCSVGGNGGGGVEGEGVFTAVHLHPVEERLSRNEGGVGV